MFYDTLIISSLIIVAFLLFYIYRIRGKAIRLNFLIYLLIGVSFVVTSYFIYSLYKAGYIFLGGNKLQMETTAQVGDFIGGVIGTVFSFIGIVLLIRTLQEQRFAFKTQAGQFLTSQAESRFFELLRLHRENINELNYKYFGDETKSVSEHIAQSRHVFVFIKNDFFHAYEELSFLFEKINVEDIYHSTYKDTLDRNKLVLKRNIDRIKYAQIDLVYLVVFFGVGKNGINNIKSITDKKYKTDFVDKLIRFAKLKPKKNSKHYRNWKTINTLKNRIEVFENILNKRDGEEYDDSILKGWLTSNNKSYLPFQGYYNEPYYKYYGGHQFRLSHYFRHIYQIVSFVDENSNIDAKEKKNYIRILRGQLSSDEQILLFLNSLSQVGRVWELECSKKSGTMSERLLISKYNILKNINTNEIIDNIKVTDFYPN